MSTRRIWIKQQLSLSMLAGISLVASGTAMVLEPSVARAQNNVALLSTAATDWLKSQAKNLAVLKGQYLFRFFGLEIYHAQLWVDTQFNATTFDKSSFALQLLYSRNLSGEEIAKRSLQEIKKQSKISTQQEQLWLEQMTKIFPDVKKGDHITGVYTPSEKAVFFFNQKLLGELSDPELTKRFFGIWLSPLTTEPKMRLHLLGLN